MKQVVTLLSCFALCSMLGFAQKKSSAPAMTDQQFVDFAGQTDMVDANLGKLASSATPALNVRDYAQKLVTDQTNDFHELAKVAHESKLDLPGAIDKEHDRAMIDPFQKLRGDAFDRRFVKDMIDGDTKAIGVYKEEASHAQTPALRTYAEEALPILQADLADAKNMANTMADKS